MTTISNFTYDELTIGQTASYSKTIGEGEVQKFAEISGDKNPVPLDADFAAGTQFGERIAHGMLTGALISAAIAMELGCDGVLMNTAIAGADKPVLMASAMRKAVEAGREAFLAGRIPRKRFASASSPLDGTIF